MKKYKNTPKAISADFEPEDIISNDTIVDYMAAIVDKNVSLEDFQKTCQNTHVSNLISIYKVIISTITNIPQEFIDELEKNINFNAPVNTKNQYLIHIAAEFGIRDDMIKRCILKTKNIEVVDEHGQTAMTYAAIMAQNLKSFEYLLKAGANDNPKDQTGVRLLDLIKYSPVYKHQLMLSAIKERTIIKDEQKELKKMTKKTKTTATKTL